MIVKGIPAWRLGSGVQDEPPAEKGMLDCPTCTGIGKLKKMDGILWLFCPLDWPTDAIRGSRAMLKCPVCQREFELYKKEEVNGQMAIRCIWCESKYKLKLCESFENKAMLKVDAILLAPL